MKFRAYFLIFCSFGCVSTRRLPVEKEVKDLNKYHKITTYSATDQSCSISWEIFDRRSDQSLQLNLRYKNECALGFEAQRNIHKELLQVISKDFDFKKLSAIMTPSFSLLDPSYAWNSKVALASSQSDEWNDFRRKYPKHSSKKSPEAMFVELVNQTDANAPLESLFAELGLQIQLKSAEKAFAQPSREMPTPFQIKLKEAGKDSLPRVLYDAGIHYYDVKVL